MPGLGFLFTAFGAVRRALSALWGMARANPALAAIVLLAGLSGWLWWGKGKAIDQRDEAIAGRAADRKAYTEAQVEAARLALAAKAATEARYRTLAKDADHAYQIELADARDAVADYIARNRVRNPTAQSPGRDPASAPDDSGSGGGERPDNAPFMVAVAESDIGICTANTLRLEAVREWAKTLAE